MDPELQPEVAKPQDSAVPTSDTQVDSSTQSSAAEATASAGTKRPRSPGPASVSAPAVDEESAANGASTSTSSPAPKKSKDTRWPKGGQKKGREYKGKERREYGWQDGVSRDKEAATGEKDGEGDGGEGGSRLPKRKVALLIGYCGTGYSGMQIQKDAKTIEGDIFEALIKAGAVSADNAVDHRKVDVQRAARTDAGVHAAGNCISLKMILEPPMPPGFDSLASYVNSFLPEQIRMWGFVKAIKSFVARGSCDSRVYEYLLPSYCLLPPASRDSLSHQLNESSPGWREPLGAAADFADAFEEGEDEEPEAEAGAESGADVDDGSGPKRRGEYERRRGWRCDAETLARFRALIAQFKGTHNFHNYTVGKPFNDRSVKRYMMSLEVKDPQVYGDIEWISVRIHGQSFMLHQIRKMMSLAMLACRTNSPPSLVPETFGPKRIHIPKAPPLGLLLQQPQFGAYNSKLKYLGGSEPRELIEWSVYEEKMEDFKRKFIYERLREDELKSHIFHKWIRQVDTVTSKQMAFLNTKGTIPLEAQLTLAANQKDTKTTEGADTAPSKGTGAGSNDILESDDEEVDQDQLKRGELEG